MLTLSSAFRPNQIPRFAMTPRSLPLNGKARAKLMAVHCQRKVFNATTKPMHPQATSTTS